MIAASALVVGLGALVAASVSVRAAQRDNLQARINHKEAGTLASHINQWQAQPLMIIRPDQPEADAAAWLLAAAQAAAIPTSQLSIRTADATGSPPTTRKRSVTVAASKLTAAQTDALLAAIRANAPAWQVLILDIDRAESERNERKSSSGGEVVIRFAATLECRLGSTDLGAPRPD